jgi:hypothetical protein
VRPNLAFGPIDSVAQYLLYLSVVVLGVLLPLLANKWRTRREERRLLARTLAALLEETRGNRRRIAASLDSLRTALALVEEAKSWYLERRSEVAAGRSGADAPPQPEGNVGISLALITRVAWDVAHHARALPLMPDDRLLQFTRAYQLQDLYLRDRAMLLDLIQQIEVLGLPADLSRTEVLDARLAVLARALLVLRYHVGLAEGMVECYDGALEEAVPAAPPPGPAPAPAG